MSDKINASIMLLRSRALETLGIIKQIDSRISESPGDAEKIADLALKFVQQEGAMISLQQMLRTAQPGTQAPPQKVNQNLPMPQPAQPAPAPKKAPAKKGSKRVITEDELKVTSPTYRKSTSARKKAKKDES